MDRAGDGYGMGRARLTRERLVGGGRGRRRGEASGERPR
jgi:hypothetical protein